MEDLEIKSVNIANLPDIVSPCILSGTLGGNSSLPTEVAEDMTREKLGYYHDRMRAGAAAKVACRGKRVLGVLEYYPIEVAPYPVIGEDLFVINCLQVPEREGRDEIEKQLVRECVKDWSSRKGVVVLGRGKSWDELGFEEVTRDAWPERDELILWLMKFWEVEEPRLAPVERDFPALKNRVRVDVFDSGHCPWGFYVTRIVEKVAEELGPQVFVEKHDTSTREAVLKYGISSGIAVNGDFQTWLRPHPVPTEKQIRQKLEEII